MSKSRIIERQNAMIILYIHLLRRQDIDEILEDNAMVAAMGNFTPKLKIGEEMHEVVVNAIERQEIFGLAMNQVLNNWRFGRLSYIEQAILLMACSELELGYQDKVVVLNEAIRLAKEFGNDESYKFINGVLDAL